MGLACGEPAKHVRHRDPHMSDTRTTASLARLDGNDLMVVHGKKSSINRGSAQQCFAGVFRPSNVTVHITRVTVPGPGSLNGLGEGYDQLP